MVSRIVHAALSGILILVSVWLLFADSTANSILKGLTIVAIVVTAIEWFLAEICDFPWCKRIQCLIFLYILLPGALLVLEGVEQLRGMYVEAARLSGGVAQPLATSALGQFLAAAQLHLFMLLAPIIAGPVASGMVGTCHLLKCGFNSFLRWLHGNK